jgi:hypothetical protein
MLKNKKLLFIAIIACLVSSVGAQETNSPYSRYGYGILKDQAVGPSKAMGGIGYGLRHGQSANPMNPASYSHVDSLTFLFDMGLTATYGKLSDGVNSRSDFNGGLDYITILIPLARGLGLSAGVLPYSSVGYKFGSTETTDNLSYIKSFAGSGGLSQIYLGTGYKLGRTGLSLGANASYLFGTLEHTRSLPSIGSSNSYTSTENSRLRLKTFKFDMGLQYELALSKKDKLTIGAVYSPKINSKADYENIHYELNSSGAAVSADTITYNGVDAGIPETYGVGFSLNRDNKLIVGADVTYQKWNDVKYSEYMGDGLSQSDRFNDRWKYALGVEYMIDPYDRSFFKRVKFRGGINYSNSYMNVINSDNNIKGYNEYGATLGFGLPVRDDLGRRFSYININFEYKKVKPKVSNMIDEQYFGVSVNVNINEFWFFRKKID